MAVAQSMYLNCTVWIDYDRNPHLIEGLGVASACVALQLIKYRL